MGRVLRTISGARLRYFSAKAGVCSLKFALDCGRPASRRATFSPDSARRLHAQPPEAPEPTTITSYFCVVDSAKGSIPPETMIADAKQCHDLRDANKPSRARSIEEDEAHSATVAQSYPFTL